MKFRSRRKKIHATFICLAVLVEKGSSLDKYFEDWLIRTMFYMCLAKFKLV